MKYIHRTIAFLCLLEDSFDCVWWYVRDLQDRHDVRFLLFLVAEELLEHGTPRDQYILVGKEKCYLRFWFAHLQTYICADAILQHISIAFDDGLVTLPTTFRLLLHGRLVDRGGLVYRVSPRSNGDLSLTPSPCDYRCVLHPLFRVLWWYHFSLAANCCTSFRFLLVETLIAMVTRTVYVQRQETRLYVVEQCTCFPIVRIKGTLY